MGIILWLIFGAIAGWIASMIMGKNDNMGPVANVLVGILGAMLGGSVAHIFRKPGVTGFNLWSLLVAVVGACILLWIVNLLTRNSRV